MKKSTVILLILLAFLFLKCKVDPESTTYETAAEPVQTDTPVSDTVYAKVPGGNFIRTADLKFEVPDVIQTTHHIEDVVAKNGGYVAYTNLSSVVTEVKTTKISSDSLLHVSSFTPSNSIIIRVPNARLDEALREITKNADFFNFRVIKSEDASIRLLGEQLSMARSEKSNKRMEKAVEKIKPDELTSAEALLIKNQENADQARISELTQKDQVKFSTVNIDIYQKPTLKKEITYNLENAEAFEQSFGGQLADSVSNGWYQVKKVILFLANLWAFSLLFFLIYVLIKKFGSRVKL
ncbi:DUF4349 domain-containing protein [Emticicia sp. CRIBPO]|uniref:DUF4349 domain-containing protein n=1 Tax=Emticicia sp. CRIBPO TaxID=2683258 RepID=UPI0014124041|nr:DUF4349 domain-containing protein [Emticicia sp. CRIBPO]NBA88374.1 DUF4349 domain-containing protein [Emticicia sp. CRIBPO]